MRLTVASIVLASMASLTLGAVAPLDGPGDKVSRAGAADLFRRVINCPCTATRTCGCGSGSWCHCEEENTEHSKAACSKNKVCGCPGGSYGYCVPN